MLDIINDNFNDLAKDYYKLQEEYEQLVQENQQLKEKIRKVREYIKKYSFEVSDMEKPSFELIVVEIKELLEILGDKE